MFNGNVFNKLEIKELLSIAPIMYYCRSEYYTRTILKPLFYATLNPVFEGLNFTVIHQVGEVIINRLFDKHIEVYIFFVFYFNKGNLK